MTNNDIIALYETLNRISENTDLKFDVTLGYIFAKNKAKLKTEATLIYNMRQEILMEYGKIEGNEIIVDKDKIDEVNEKITELAELENDVSIMTIELNQLEPYKLSIEDIEGLMPMINPVLFTGPPILEEKTDD